MTDLDRLSLNHSSFLDFKEHNFIYVDKTDLVAKLASRIGFYLITRPKGFGKTTLLHTLEEYFLNGKTNFQGLKLADVQMPDYKFDQDPQSRKVLFLDFAKIDDYSPDLSFKERFAAYIAEVFSSLNITYIKRNEIPSDCYKPSEGAELYFKHFDDEIYEFDYSLSRNRGMHVLLVDNYDAPLIKVIDDEQEFQHRKSFLCNFFSFFKNNYGYSGVRFALIAGEHYFIEGSHLEAFTNHQDLSFEPDLASLLGFTYDEITTYFKDYLNPATNFLDAKDQDYLFNLNGSGPKVYNQSLILNYLAHPNADFNDLLQDLFNSHLDLLDEYLKHRVQDKTIFELFDPNFKLYASLTVLKKPLKAKADPNAQDPLGLLYQAGFFTLKNRTLSLFELTVPYDYLKELIQEKALEIITAQSLNDLNSTFRVKNLT